MKTVQLLATGLCGFNFCSQDVFLVAVNEGIACLLNDKACKCTIYKHAKKKYVTSLKRYHHATQLFYHKYIDTHHFKKIHQKSDIIKKTYRPRATEHLQEVWSNNKLYEFISSLFLGLQLVQIKCHGLRKLGCHKYFQFFCDNECQCKRYNILLQWFL